MGKQALHVVKVWVLVLNVDDGDRAATMAPVFDHPEVQIDHFV